jgi:hypothetical protein
VIGGDSSTSRGSSGPSDSSSDSRSWSAMGKLVTGLASLEIINYFHVGLNILFIHVFQRAFTSIYSHKTFKKSLFIQEKFLNIALYIAYIYIFISVLSSYIYSYIFRRVGFKNRIPNIIPWYVWNYEYLNIA